MSALQYDKSYGTKVTFLQVKSIEAEQSLFPCDENGTKIQANESINLKISSNQDNKENKLKRQVKCVEAENSLIQYTPEDTNDKNSYKQDNKASANIKHGNNITDGSTTQLPGERGFSIANAVALKIKGHLLFANKIQTLNSTVFQINLFGLRVMLCDSDSIRYLFRKTLVKKRRGFGIKQFQTNVLSNYTPLIFQNNPEHDQTKAVLQRYFELVRQQFNFTELSSFIESELNTLSEKSKTQKNFEDTTMCSVSNIITYVLFGKVLHFPSIREWFSQVFDSRMAVKKLFHVGHNAYNTLINEIQTSSFFEQLIVEKSIEIEKTHLTNELLMCSSFNGIGSMTSMVLSCIIYLIKMPEDEKEKLVKESKIFLATENFQDALNYLKYTGSFVLEVLRLHPPAHKIFGVAAKNFILSAKKSKYYIRKNTLLCGDIYNSQRNAEYFNNPNKFVLERFLRDPTLTKHLIVFGGDFNNHDTAHHHCLGQHLAILILKLCVVHLCTYQIEPVAMPFWTGKKYGRLSASDKPLLIESFSKKLD